MAERKYTYIDVVDTAILCGLDIKQSTLANDEVQAMCPYCGDYKYRMYLSHKPENATFWCHNCGTGGNAITLYVDFNPEGRRLSNGEAFRELLRHPGVRCDEVSYEKQQRQEDPIRPLHERSEIYLELLKMLPLERKHYVNLHNRGLSDEIIRGNMYRSIPTNYGLRQRIVADLARRYDLSGAPGFYTKNHQWQMSNCKLSGILLPVADHQNYIQGLQIRLDDPPPKMVVLPDGTRAEKKGERFRWLSSGGMSDGKKYYENGTGIPSYIHVVGDLSSDTLHITEGPLKADIASYLSGGELFIGLTGVQNVAFLKDVILQLKPKRILECIDMDIRTNENVQKAQSKIRAICAPLVQDYRPFTWPVEQKGIDDWLLFEKLKREHGLAVQY